MIAQINTRRRFSTLCIYMKNDFKVTPAKRLPARLVLDVTTNWPETITASSNPPNFCPNNVLNGCMRVEVAEDRGGKTSQ